MSDKALSDEARAPTGYVHVCLGSLEAGAHWIWLEHVHNISPVMLVDETERYLVCERPLQDGVKLSLHHDKEQRHVCILTNTITQYVETKAHLVTIATGVEGQTED